LARIAARYADQRNTELALSDTYRAEEAALAPEDAPPPPEVAPPEPAPVAPEPAPAVTAAPLRNVTLPDGGVVQVTDDQFAQLAQMGILANLALSQPVMQPPVAPAAPAPRRELVDEERAREFVRQVQFGAPDEALPAVRWLIEDVVSRIQMPHVDPNAIIHAATLRARAEQQAERDVAIIRSDFPDIFANPQLQRLAHINVDELARGDAATGRQRPLVEIYREAGNRVYDAIGRPRPGSDPTAPALQAAPHVQERPDVIERKRAAPRIPAAVDRRAATPDAPRPPTASEIVSQMRVSRGQSPLT